MLGPASGQMAATFCDLPQQGQWCGGVPGGLQLQADPGKLSPSGSEECRAAAAEHSEHAEPGNHGPQPQARESCVIFR